MVSSWGKGKFFAFASAIISEISNIVAGAFAFRAGVILLESLESAKARGAKIYCEVSNIQTIHVDVLKANLTFVFSCAIVDFLLNVYYFSWLDMAQLVMLITSLRQPLKAADSQLPWKWL